MRSDLKNGGCMDRLVALGVLILSGCATTGVEDTVKKKAAFEFDCPNEKIELIQTSSDGANAIYSYGVKGCGQRATYICQKNAFSEATCVKESETTRKK